MISLKSLNIYLTITIPIHIYCLISHFCIKNYNNFISFFLFNLTHNLSIIYIMKNKVNKPLIKDNNKNSETYNHEFLINTISLLTIKSKTHQFIYNKE